MYVHDQLIRALIKRKEKKDSTCTRGILSSSFLPSMSFRMVDIYIYI